MNDSENAKDIFSSGKYTCVLCKGDIIHTSNKNGISPMIEFIEDNLDINGFSAADKIVGKAAAMLFIASGIKYVYADVMSRQAAEILDRFNVKFEYGIIAESIINRAGNDICPMEKAVENINIPDKAYLAVKSKLRELQNK